MKLAIAALILVCPDFVFAQKVAVKIIQRQDRNLAYIFVVAGHSASRLYTDPNVNCHGLATATSINTVSYCVRGATFALQLPDGRVAIVNCFNKAFVFFPVQARSCRKPITDDVQAEFHGDNAKLEWAVSPDRRNAKSETYKVLAFIDKPKSDQN